ncbi:alpha/beta fold hydrolase [Paracoccus tegillarcae]|uniref:AB hydrolase-1 domain-containing protein n=1 Tax=Paracoccus tegillarcae TaxID=1529068 RepID=A0A2K9EHK9_9RHOB|nr:alpha/beta fold hydrolase [Paracoccus tegillarcae]AUH34450.1 hypothetical protein CUV01_14590 [Paracoccus tegillarcae]
MLARLWRLERRMDGPVQVLWGQADQWLPAAQGDALAALKSDQPMIRVPGCGHLMQEDAPEAVVAAVMGTAR